MAAGKDDNMSVVDIIRRSMAESFGNSKRKLDNSEPSDSNNKRLHCEKDEIGNKPVADDLGSIDYNYFQPFDEPLKIKEEPSDVVDDEYALENDEMSVNEELSPIPGDDNDNGETSQPKWDILESEHDQTPTENKQTEDPFKIKPESVEDGQHQDKHLTVSKQQNNIDFKSKLEHKKVTKKQESQSCSMLYNHKLDTDNDGVSKTKEGEDSQSKPYVLNITFLQALYLRCHEDGIAFIQELTSDYLADVEVESKGLIKISEGRFQKKIMKHLHEAKVISVPSKGQNLANFLDVLVTELSKGCSVQDLRILLQKLKMVDHNKHAYYQTINMKIFGFFQWEYGQQFMNILKNIPTFDSDITVDKSIINSIEDLLHYLIENERPLKLYGDIIESICSAKSNFLDAPSIDAMNLFNNVAKNTCQRKIVIDDMKYDYFINSLTAKLMVTRWKSKLRISIEDVGEDTLLCLTGSETDVQAAYEEFRTQIAEGPMLPFGTLQVYSFVIFLLDKIKDIQRNLDKFDAEIGLNKIMELENVPPNARRDKRMCYLYEDLHTYIFAIRGLQQGKEKLFVLCEFVANYKLSLMTDNLRHNEWKMVQDAFVVLQYKKNNTVENYRYFLKCLNSMRHAEAIILTLEEYKILSETVAGKSIIEVLGKVVDFDVTFSRIFSTKHATLTILGTEYGILTCKKKLYDFLDRVIISECSVTDLENKLNTALENLWTTPITKTDALDIFNRIQILTAKNHVHMVEAVRELYAQLHIYLFGRCRLLNGQTHVTKLRIYYQYIKSEKSTTPEILNDIINSYEMLFGKNEKQDINYTTLIDRSSDDMFERNSQRDINTVCICDSVVRAHFYNNAIAKDLLKSYIDESIWCKLVFTVKQFVSCKLIILTSGTVIDRKLPVIIKSESVRIFSQRQSKILEDLTVSLQAIAEVKENMTHIKAKEIFKVIQNLEKNLAPTSVIEIKYQILNIYLFGCCGFYGGLVHLEVLKGNHTKMSKSQDVNDDVITDKHTRASLVNAYEFIFWKGKKDSVDYDFLLHKAGIVCENNMHTLPLSSEMYGYLTHVKEGMQLLETCAASVKVKVTNDDVKKICLVNMEGDRTEIEKFIQVLINETKNIKAYFDIPFVKEDLVKYIKKKLKELYMFDSLEVPVHTMLHLQNSERILETPLSEPDCSQILHLRSTYYMTLHKYMFSVFEIGESTQHISALKKYVDDLSTNNSEDHLDLNTIQSINNIINNYLFSTFKIPHLDYKRSLKQCIRSDKLNIYFSLSKHVGEYLNNCNDESDSTKLLIKHKEAITNTLIINAYDEQVDQLRDWINEYTLILKHIPMKKNDLIKLIKLLFNRISDSKYRDPKTIWTSMQICKKQDSKFAVDRLPLTYSRLHTHLFGYRQLLKGKELVQCLGQHEYNLEMIKKPEEIVSIQVLKDIYIALQYIEGNADKGVDYRALISKVGKKNVKESNNRRCGRAAAPGRSFSITSDIRAPQPQREYLQNTGTGKALVNSIQNSFVHIKFESDFLRLRGSDKDVKLATRKLHDYFTMIYALPLPEHQLRFAIASCMRKLRSNKVEIGHIASLYTEIFKIELNNIDSSRKVNKTLLNGHYHALHINLFGCLRLMEGEKHVCFLRTFNEGKCLLNESSKRKLYEAYDYIFGSTKKDLDYSIIIRDLCGNSCFYVSKALERLLEIQNRIKKGKDSFIGPSSVASVDKWISAIKEDMFNDQLIIAAHKFLNKYEDIRDNKKDITLI